MFLKVSKDKKDNTYNDKIKTVVKLIERADAVIIGAGVGLTKAAGDYFDENNFKAEFGDFIDKYGFKNMKEAADYKFASDEEKWAMTSRYVYLNRYKREINDTYKFLYNIVKNKKYFVITTNLESVFQEVGFIESRLYNTHGDYGLFQCSIACHNKTYDNKNVICRMVELQRDMKVPSELIPVCPKCGNQMSYNLRVDNSFVENAKYERSLLRYETFVSNNANKKVVFLEIGVGHDRPGVIKYPFWNMVKRNRNASYICINADDASFTPEIKDVAIGIEGNITEILENINKKMKKSLHYE